MPLSPSSIEPSPAVLTDPVPTPAALPAALPDPTSCSLLRTTTMPSSSAASNTIHDAKAVPLSPGRTSLRPSSPNNSTLSPSLSKKPASSTPVRFKRFRFTETADVDLLKAVSAANAHIAPRGQKGILFEEAHATFLRTAPRTVLGEKEPPSQKSLEDRLKVILCRRREEVKRSAGASGIVEVYGEKATLADDIILGIEEHAEEERDEKDAKLEKEKRLTSAGLEVRHRALNRTQGSRSRSRSGSVAVEIDGNSNGEIEPGSPSSTVPKVRRRMQYESDDDATEAFVRDMTIRQEQDSWRLQLEEQRHALEQKRIEDEQRRFEAAQETERRKITLEEKRAAVEIEERKQAKVERPKMI